MLERFPNSVVLYNIAGASNAGLMLFDAAIDSYKQALIIKPDYADAYYNMGIALKDKGDLEAAIDSYKQALKIKPDYADAYNNMGIALKDKGDPEAAIDSYKKALKIKPDYADAYNNMGNALKDKGDLEAAIGSYKKALKIKPDYADTYNNMGIALKDKGDLEAAIDSYKKALKIKPDYADAYNNMGITLEDKGDPEAAIDSYKQALKIEPNYAKAKANLVKLLTTYTPQKENQNLIVTVNEEIRKIDIKDSTSKIISDDQAVNLFSKSEDCISIFGLELRTELSQIYRRNSFDFNCRRHMSIFDKHDIIPEFCFGCYKVQVEPRSIIELIKLFIVFDQLELNENNTRKCMVELRPEIAGFYKGLIYCSGLKQANQIAEHLDTIVKQSIGPGLTSKVKRGCSEYPISFPSYKEINNSGPQLMNYIEEWRVIEESYDRKKPIQTNEVIRISLSGLNLSDVLIIRNWIDYAKGIEDPSADLLNQNTVYYQDIYNKAKARLDVFNISY
jgi:tetratricopeptide (TPR) repeat protein